MDLTAAALSLLWTHMERESIRIQKAARREECRARRRELTAKQAAAAGRAILQRLGQLDEYAGAWLVHTYVSTKENEVDTHGLIRRCLEQGRRVAVPVVRPGTRILAHAEIQGLEQLVPDAWGIPSPPPDHGEWIEALDEIELIVVPGVAFDARGHRLGLGGGYYDRFLSRVSAPKVGLTYDCLLLDEVPLEPHDAVMDIVVTESAVYRTRGT